MGLLKGSGRADLAYAAAKVICLLGAAKPGFGDDFKEIFGVVEDKVVLILFKLVIHCPGAPGGATDTLDFNKIGIPLIMDGLRQLFLLGENAACPAWHAKAVDQPFAQQHANAAADQTERGPRPQEQPGDHAKQDGQTAQQYDIARDFLAM